jgi:hypothetical protein
VAERAARRGLVKIIHSGGRAPYDRRIMSPVRQQPSSGWLTWADMESRDHARTDLGTYLA